MAVDFHTVGVERQKTALVKKHTNGRAKQIEPDVSPGCARDTVQNNSPTVLHPKGRNPIDRKPGTGGASEKISLVLPFDRRNFPQHDFDVGFDCTGNWHQLGKLDLAPQPKAKQAVMEWILHNAPSTLRTAAIADGMRLVIAQSPHMK